MGCRGRRQQTALVLGWMPVTMMTLNHALDLLLSMTLTHQALLYAVHQ
jgi:hypothetical protein